MAKQCCCPTLSTSQSILFDNAELYNLLTPFSGIFDTSLTLWSDSEPNSTGTSISNSSVSSPANKSLDVNTFDDATIWTPPNQARFLCGIPEATSETTTSTSAAPTDISFLTIPFVLGLDSNKILDDSPFEGTETTMGNDGMSKKPRITHFKQETNKFSSVKNEYHQGHHHLQGHKQLQYLPQYPLQYPSKHPSIPIPVQQQISTSISDNMIPKMRTACDACTRSKIKCSGPASLPCETCRKSGKRCIFTPQRKRGPTSSANPLSKKRRNKRRNKTF
jgi:hypothetical protein